MSEPRTLQLATISFGLMYFQIECSKAFIFKDEKSKQKYMDAYVAFRERSRRRDEFMEHEEVRTISKS